MLLVASVTLPAALLLDRWLGADEHAVARAHAALWLAALSALGLAWMLATAFTRRLSRPILAMTRAARAMASGDFSISLPTPGDDELGDLVLSLEMLRNQLAARLEELRVEGVKLRTIVNGMAEGVALVQRGQITVVNPAFEKLLGVTRVEGRRPLEAARLPELADIIAAATIDRQEARREAQIGTRTLLLHAHPLGAPASEQAVVVALDISETRRLERLRRDFVANASHELRTPVAAIVGVAETLAGGASEDAAARASFVDILVRHAQRLTRLTADLLDIARLEAGYQPRVEPVVVHDVVDAVVGTLRPRADEQHIALTAEVPSELQVVAERAAVEQILTNFVDNAIKYTPPGGSVTVRAAVRGDRVCISVADTGPGIPAEHLQRLFERFYRVDDARSRELGGTGLGLAIVKHLALAHGGDVEVESALGRGSTFAVTLPRG
jgi:two-component system phosphate regulon sensor histidine kinase PhoR